ncbi:hypothetical protein [Microvirga lenta]|uniref:hypothetical protein n=1 Tax=Microvirga lenta TaxID=2881337 RepID=UPI001CFF7934|nr:hypothetical protein [Microvirga lenta]MCB5175931.1 hypothetical protein [Microvirga lenta]
MSLTQELDNKDSYVRQFMDAWFPDLPKAARAMASRLRASPLIHPVNYETKNLYMLVGTASDYRLRAFFDPAVHRCAMVQEGLRYCQMSQWPGFRNPWKPRKGFALADAFVQAYEDFIVSIDLRTPSLDQASEDRLARFCFWFAQLDAFNRSRVSAMFSPPWLLHLSASPNIESMLSGVPDAVAADVTALAKGFRTCHEDVIEKAETVFMGESLDASEIVGNADFDLVADGMLYEFKAMLRPQGIAKILRQVVGYWLLDREDRFGIRKASIVFTRQEHAETFDIAPGLLGISDGAEVRHLFHEGAASGVVPRVPDGLKRELPSLVPLKPKPIWEEPIVPKHPPPTPRVPPRSWVEPNGSIMVEDEPEAPRTRRGRPPKYGRAMTPAERGSLHRLRRKQKASPSRA